MKKTGFTLAEILITLAIVGVVAALAIPAVVTNAKRQAMATKLASVVTDIENAAGNMMTDEDQDDFFETKFGSNRSNVSDLRKHLNYINNGTGLTSVDYSSDSPFSTLDGTAQSGENFSTWTVIRLKNGAVVFFDPNKDSCHNSNKDKCVTPNGMDTHIDVNGPEGPNKWGRDVFGFAMGNDGILYPIGSYDYEYIIGTENPSNANAIKNPCPANSWACAYRLVKNNYKVDY